jgi:hypothetical protein
MLSLSLYCHVISVEMLTAFHLTFRPWPVQSVHFLCPQRHELRPKRSKEDLSYHFKKGMVCQFYNGMVSPPACEYSIVDVGFPTCYSLKQKSPVGHPVDGRCIGSSIKFCEWIMFECRNHPTDNRRRRWVAATFNVRSYFLTMIKKAPKSPYLK